jgi:hypothetical protein
MDPTPIKMKKHNSGGGNKNVRPASPMHKLFGGNGNSQAHKDEFQKNVPSFYVVYKDVGLWDPIKFGAINEKFEEFISCLKSLIDFEKFYI